MRTRYSTLQEGILAVKNERTSGITFVTGTNEEHVRSYGDLYGDALNLLGAMQKRGLEKGSEVIIQAENNITFVRMFWACVLGGAIPVPLEIARTGTLKDKLKNVVQTLSDPFILVENDQKYGIREFLDESLSENEHLPLRALSYNDLSEEIVKGEIIPVAESDTAFIQFSSGSTGLPKGIILTNKNVCTNIHDIITYSDSDHDRNIMVSWIPLTHDMGLIGMHLCMLFLNSHLINIETQVFIRNPLVWLNKLSEYKATATQSPNFGYNYVMNALKEGVEYDWNLEHLELIFNGAEPISTLISDRFLDFFEQYGLKRSAMFTVYGMAESSLATTFPVPRTAYTKLVIDRQKIAMGQEVQEIDSLDPNALDVVCCGKPVGDMTLKIVGKDGQVLGESQVGEILISGDNVTAGYYGIEDKGNLFDEEGALRTGDMGFVHQGNLYVTGREKELIIINGQNFYPHDIEENLSRILEYPLGRIVAGSVRAQEGERIIVFVQFRKKTADFAPVAKSVSELIIMLTGDLNPLVLPVKRTPKTTSGKIQRRQLIGDFEKGEFDLVQSELEELLQEERLDAALPKAEMKREIVHFITRELSGYLERDIHEIDTPLMDLGLTSKQMLFLQAKLSRFVGEKIEIVTLFNHPTIIALSEHLADEIKGSEEIESDELLDEVAGMTDEEIARLLDELG